MQKAKPRELFRHGMNCNFDVNPDIINQVSRPFIYFVFSFDEIETIWKPHDFAMPCDKCGVYNLFEMQNGDLFLLNTKLGGWQALNDTKTPPTIM